MSDSTQEASYTPSPVYGPVNSWRFGRSLGIDPIVVNSICSFNCVYCQLGEIQDITAGRAEFISTARVAEGLDAVNWDDVDVVTISGSGEPTLATNLGEIVDLIKARCDKPIHILTNATLFGDPEARRAVMEIDTIACKLDGATDAMMRKINRPAEGVTLDSIVEGILELKKEFTGRLELQIMFMPMNRREASELAALIRRIDPAEAQLNTPKRPYPLEWHVESRGAHNLDEIDWPTRRLAALTQEAAEEVEAVLRAECDTPIHSIYHDR